MKTYIDKEVGRVFVLTLAEMQQLRRWAEVSMMQGGIGYKQTGLTMIATQLVMYLKKAEE